MSATGVAIPRVPVIAVEMTLTGGGPVTALATALPAIVIGESFDQPRYAEFIRLKAITDRYVPEVP